MIPTFKDPELRRRALTHRSHHRYKNNEQLELLGDAVLHLVLVDYYQANSPDATEGDLCKIVAWSENGKHLTECAYKLGLDRLILVGGSEIDNVQNRGKVLEDAMEAMIGAIYRDQGLQAARDFILRYIR